MKTAAGDRWVDVGLAEDLVVNQQSAGLRLARMVCISITARKRLAMYSIFLLRAAG
jgi:hypothetical protein